MIGGGIRGIPDAVKNLLILNVIAFLATMLLQTRGIDLNALGGLYHPYSAEFRPYQLITHMFLHGGVMHIFFNMFALWMLGSPLEQVWGPKRFLIFYFVCGLGAALLLIGVNHIQIMHLQNAMSHTDFEMVRQQGAALLEQGKNYTDPSLGKLNYLLNVPTIGASGAIFGILLGFGMLFPNTRLLLLFFPVPIKAKYFVAGYALLELYFGIRQAPGDNIAYFAHIGGMIFGFILIKIWQKRRRDFY